MSKFKDELRRYRKPPSTAIKQHLARWLEDERAEAVWQKVTAAAGANLTAEEFILTVIRARADAAGLPYRIKGNARDRAHVIKWHQPRIAEALKSNKSLSEIASVLEDAAFEMRQIEKFSTLDLAEYPAGAESRKQNGSQSRRAFCLIMSKFFKERCDLWMDSEVAVLLDIALPRGAGRQGGHRRRPAEKATDIQEVRDYRRSVKNLVGDSSPQNLN